MEAARRAALYSFPKGRCHDRTPRVPKNAAAAIRVEDTFFLERGKLAEGTEMVLDPDSPGVGLARPGLDYWSYALRGRGRDFMSRMAGDAV